MQRIVTDSAQYYADMNEYVGDAGDDAVWDRKLFHLQESGEMVIDTRPQGHRFDDAVRHAVAELETKSE